MRKDCGNLPTAITALGGLVQPIVVRPIDVDRYEVVAGARRFRAAKLANIHELVAHVMDLIEVQLIENAQRQDVHPYEEAAAYNTLLSTHRYDVGSIATKVGKQVRVLRCSRTSLKTIAVSTLVAFSRRWTRISRYRKTPQQVSSKSHVRIVRTSRVRTGCLRVATTPIIESEQARCTHATPGIAVEGSGRRGELLQVCANPNCESHGKADYRTAQEAETEQRHSEWQQRQAEREKHRKDNRRLLESTIKQVPKSLCRADYEMLLFAAINRLDYDDLDAERDRYNIDTDDVREHDGAIVALQEIARRATERQLTCMLVELALLPSGYSNEPLEPTDLLDRRQGGTPP
jgi:hypothetical protein